MVRQKPAKLPSPVRIWVPPYFLKSMLYIVSTPIGNLSDFTLRAQETLKLVDYILCEDTRTSAVLLNRFEIKKPLKSFHKFNETSGEDRAIEDLQEGKLLAIISDAGTPGISDPGEKLIHRCIAENIPVTPIPGPTALITALIISGFPTTPFQYVGFLPKKASEYKTALTSLLLYPGTSILYESPHRIMDLLEILPATRLISVSRELTKKFEETKRGSAAEIKEWFTQNPPRGEFVVVIGQGSDEIASPLTLEEECQKLQGAGLSRNEILRKLSQSAKLTKREIVKLLPQYFTKL